MNQIEKLHLFRIDWGMSIKYSFGLYVWKGKKTLLIKKKEIKKTLRCLERKI